MDISLASTVGLAPIKLELAAAKTKDNQIVTEDSKVVEDMLGTTVTKI